MTYLPILRRVLILGAVVLAWCALGIVAYADEANSEITELARNAAEAMALAASLSVALRIVMLAVFGVIGVACLWMTWRWHKITSEVETEIAVTKANREGRA